MDRAISPVQAQTLLKNAGIPDMKLNDIISHIKGHIQKTGFTRKAMFITESDEYDWAHNTAPGIIWLWSEQTPDIQSQWLREPKSRWVEFEFKEPSHDSPIGWGSSTSMSTSASRASAAYPQPGPLSFKAVSVPSSPRSPRSSRSPRKHKGGGYCKRRTRKTRRKSSRRGRSRSRSRSHQIRRKKTHHRRHRR